jgi:K+-transporting ATPase ATPase A chain
VLLPLSFIFALVLVSQGVVQNFDPYVQATGYGTAGPQTIAMGPVASQEAIKELGTNGGGFFTANSAHPFENPTWATNLIEIFLILLVPASLPFTFASFIGDRRQGWAIYGVMIILFLVAFVAIYTFETMGNPLVRDLGASGIPMEGKEVRFGLAGTALFTTATTATSCGAVNAMLDSLTPLAGMIPMVLILLGEVVYGGVGSGFYTLIAFFILAVFIAGLMIGRTPEYLGKKIEVFEMRMAVVTVLIAGILVLVLSGTALMMPGGTESMQSQDPHGLSELVYAFGSLAKKKIVPPSLGTLPTGTFTFVVWVILVILIIGALTFFPLFATGPVVEYMRMIGV